MAHRLCRAGLVYHVSCINVTQVKVLYVKNLKSLVTEDELRQVFTPYGSVGRVKKTKDYGFIHFDNREDALRAMEELNGTVSRIFPFYFFLKISCQMSYDML